jgi:hypothetical protein
MPLSPTRRTADGCVAYVVLLYSVADRGMAYYALRAAHALAMWCLILGVTGLFLRYLSGHSPLGRYLCDSSYFLYIAHLPVIMLFQLILLGVPLPPLAKSGWPWQGPSPCCCRSITTPCGRPSSAPC